MKNDFQIEDGKLISYYGAGGDVVIPESVTIIEESAFADCSSLTSVVIPEGVTNIEVKAFYRCTSLTSVVIPDSVTSIGKSAFWACTSLKSVIIPEGVTSIGKSVFWSCTSLKSVIIPEGVTNIERRAFCFCTSLTSVVIPESITSIEGAFWNCSSLTSIHIPDSVIHIDKTAFCDCQNLKVTYRGFTFFPDISGQISVCEIADMIEKRDFSAKMPARVKYSAVWNVFCINPQDEETLALIKKGFQRMFKFLIDENDIQTIQKVLAFSDLVTKENIDKLILDVIDNQKHEIQVMLMNHKAKKGWYEDSEEAIHKKFRL